MHLNALDSRFRGNDIEIFIFHATLGVAPADNNNVSNDSPIGQIEGFDVYPIFNSLGLDTESQWLTAINIFSPDISDLLAIQSDFVLLGARLQGLMPGSSLSRNVRRYLSSAKILEGRMQGLFAELPQDINEIPFVFRSRGDLEYYVEGKLQRDRESAEGAAGLARS